MIVSNEITAEELRALARERGVDGYSQMQKIQLMDTFAKTGVVIVDGPISVIDNSARHVFVKVGETDTLDFSQHCGRVLGKYSQMNEFLFSI